MDGENGILESRREELFVKLRETHWDAGELMDVIEDCAYLSVDRVQHILGVAVKMRGLADSMHPEDEGFAHECLLLGLLHDIGYALAESDVRPHEEIGGGLLRELGYEHWQEVRYHGLPAYMRDGYDSELLKLLNFADMSVRGDGCEVTLDERIEDIAERYGSRSVQVTRAQEVKAEVEAWLGKDAD